MPALDEPIQTLVDPENPCFGCGPHNPEGLQLESRPADGGLVSTFTGRDVHAGSFHVMGGGVQATLADCHGIWTALDWYARQGHDPVPHFVTAELHLTYLAPTPLGEEVTLRSEVLRHERRRVWVEVEVVDPDGRVTTRAEVVCHRTDEPWGPNPYGPDGSSP